MNDSLVNSTSPHASIDVASAGYWQIGITEMCTLSFSFLCGFPTQSYVVYLLTRSENPSEFISLNLSVCEIILSWNSLFILLTKWFLSLTPCTQFFFGLTITGRPLFQCLICVERYLAVVHPVTFLKYKPLRYRVMCCAVAWIICLLSCLCCLFLLISFNFYLCTWYFTIQFLLLLSFKFFCLVAVLRALKHSGPGERGKEEENHMKRRAFYLILIITVSTVITYVPFTVNGLLTILIQWSVQALWTFSINCFMLAGFIQAIFYLHRTGKIGTHVYRKICNILFS